MYIRWKNYLHKDRSRSLRAEIIESYRDCVTGEPRNRTIRYLGSFRERDFSNRKWLYLYWRLIDEKLSLLRLAPEDEQSVKAKLAERIPLPPTSLELRRNHRKSAPQLTSSANYLDKNAPNDKTDTDSPSVAELSRFLTELLERVG